MTEPHAPRAAAHAAAGATPEPLLTRALELLAEVGDLLADAVDLPPTPWDRVAPDTPPHVCADDPGAEPGPTRIDAAGHAVLAARWLLRSALGDEIPGGGPRRAVGRLADATKCAAAVVDDRWCHGPPQ
jgi:hypothetical protein